MAPGASSDARKRATFFSNQPRPTGTVPVPRSVYERYAEPYAMRIEGHCLDPIIRDGDTVIAAPDAPWEPGGVVIIYHHNGKSSVKILVSAQPPSMMKVHPESTVMPLVMVRMLNPPRVLSIAVDKIKALHGLVGVFHKEATFDHLYAPAAPPGMVLIEEGIAVAPAVQREGDGS